MMVAGNECSLGGAVIIVAAFRVPNYGETDISRWGYKHACSRREGQRAKVDVCATLPKRNKDVLANGFPRIFTFLRIFCVLIRYVKSDIFSSVCVRVNTKFVIYHLFG
jgi:hypothetical protein